jgi:F0F1-type ATP synthase assembly protein I
MKDQTPATTGIFQIGAGNLLASMTISGFFLGYLVDQWFDKTPLFMLSFGFLGIIGGMKRVHEMLSHQRTDSDSNDLNTKNTEAKRSEQS